MDRIVNAIVSDELLVNSCRFCCIGMGLHRVSDEVKNEVFYLCDKHLAEYNIDDDSIPAPVVEPEEVPE